MDSIPPSMKMASKEVELLKSSQSFGDFKSSHDP